MKTLKLPVIITQDEDGYFVAEVPILPSCYTQGKTKQEALANIVEVIQLCVESMAEDGRPVPAEYSVEQVEVPV